MIICKPEQLDDCRAILRDSNPDETPKHNMDTWEEMLETEWHELVTTDRGQRDYIAEFNRYYKPGHHLRMPACSGVIIDRKSNTVTGLHGGDRWLLPTELEFIPAGHEYRVKFSTYAQYWRAISGIAFPSPEELAMQLTAVDESLRRGIAPVWLKPECADTCECTTQVVPDLSLPVTHVILERQPWEVQFDTKFTTQDTRLYVGGRFGTVPLNINQEG